MAVAAATIAAVMKNVAATKAAAAKRNAAVTKAAAVKKKTVKKQAAVAAKLLLKSRHRRQPNPTLKLNLMNRKPGVNYTPGFSFCICSHP